MSTLKQLISPPERVPLSALIGPPPSGESEQQRRDLKAVLDAQAARTNAQVERAKATADLSVLAFADVLGPGFTKERLPAILFLRIYTDSVATLEMTKNLWKRPRPFVSNAEVTPAGERPKSTSYPSGNALLGQLYATGSVEPGQIGGHKPKAVSGGHAVSLSFVFRTLTCSV